MEIIENIKENDINTYITHQLLNYLIGINSLSLIKDKLTPMSEQMVKNYILDWSKNEILDALSEQINEIKLNDDNYLIAKNDKGEIEIFVQFPCPHYYIWHNSLHLQLS